MYNIATTKRTREEYFNTLTHLGGFLFALSAAWTLLRLGYQASWQLAFGVTSFCVAMMVMYAASTVYHWALPGRLKRALRVFDHISIYMMIAGSYTPVCIGAVGGALGWTVFGILWAIAIGGAVYKITAINRWPRLSLFIYLLMGWAGVLIAAPVWQSLSGAALACIGAEGIFYTGGTYFFAHDDRRFYHGIWHIFVLLGSLAHCAAVLFILL